jgi:hypothetical protein
MDFIFISKVPPVAPYTSPVREKWPSFGQPFRPFKDVNTKQESPAVKTAELTGAASPSPVTNPCAEVVVESIDPRKLPLFHYINAEFLPDAPKDDTDVSTKACWQRQARTIHGLLSDLEGRDKRNTHLSTELEISKSRVKELEGIVGRQAGSIQNQSDYISTLRDERYSYKGQVLKNTEGIAVVKYSQRDYEWHLVQNGIAYRYFLRSDYLQALLTLTNEINLGRVPVNTAALIRKPYYYKEDYV